MGNQVFGQGLDVGVGDGEGEEQFQEFVILQSRGPALQETVAEALAVAVVVGLLSLRGHLGLPEPPTNFYHKISANYIKCSF